MKGKFRSLLSTAYVENKTIKVCSKYSTFNSNPFQWNFNDKNGENYNKLFRQFQIC